MQSYPHDAWRVTYFLTQHSDYWAGDVAPTIFITKCSHKHRPRLSNISTFAVSSLTLIVNSTLNVSHKAVLIINLFYTLQCEHDLTTYKKMLYNALGKHTIL
jgi:hypothetical protein